MKNLNLNTMIVAMVAVSENSSLGYLLSKLS
jgi:hypothetical protein